jgi:hypothetical protein
MGRWERRLSCFILFFEDIVKVPLFRCKRCGECLLSKTGFICSQRCPKRLRNGPCGGTDEKGHCEVYPERSCIWRLIHKQSRFLHRASFLEDTNKMHNWELEKTAAWLNVYRGRIEGPVFFRKKKRVP